MPSPRSTRRSSVSVSTLVSRSIPYSSGGSSLPSIAYSRIPLPASRSGAKSSEWVRGDRLSPLRARVELVLGGPVRVEPHVPDARLRGGKLVRVKHPVTGELPDHVT